MKSKSNLKPKSKSKIRTRLVADAFLTPSLIGVLIFFVLPFGVIFKYAFTDNPVNSEFCGFDNFVALFHNTAFLTAAKNTLVFSVIAVPLAVILSLLLAMMLEANIPGKSKFRTFFLSPMMVPVASVVLIWQVLFAYNGALNSFLKLFGLEGVDWMNSEWSLVVVGVLFLWKNLGYNMILFMSAISNIPNDQLEAASVDGAGSVRRFFSIKLRYLSPSILFVTILSIINSFKVFREVYLLSGNYPYQSMYMLQHFMNNTFQANAYQKMAAAALVMMLVMLIIIGALFLIEGRYGKDVEE